MVDEGRNIRSEAGIRMKTIRDLRIHFSSGRLYRQ